MTRSTVNPTNLYDSLQYGFSHATVSCGRTVVHCSGQVGWDNAYNVVGSGDVVKQARQALMNLKTVLAEAHAVPANVSKLKVFVVDHKPDYLQSVGKEISDFFGDVEPGAMTWVGVQCLTLPELLIEIEATAYID